MDFLAAAMAQNKVETVKKNANLRYDQYLQDKALQQSGNIYTDAAAAEQKQTAGTVSNTVEEEKDSLSFEAIA